MNAEVDRFAASCKAHYERHGSPAAARLHALQRLKLKTVVKESHCSPVHQLLFNSLDPECGNLLASVGKDQLTVYDDMHMGDYISVAVQFVNAATQFTKGGGLQACAWLDARSWTGHSHGDTCLAVAGTDPTISVISIADACVTQMLQGHSREVVALAATAAAPRLLASLSRDGELRTWDVPTATCTSRSPSSATSLAVQRDGSCLITGSKRGALHCWTLPTSGASGGPASDLQSACEPLQLSGVSHSDAIDSMVFLSAQRLATHSADGWVCIWDWQQQTLVSSWKVPHTTAGCGFSSSQDGSYVCAGNAKGSVYVHDARDGRRIVSMAPEKVAAPVRACALSSCCRHLLAAAGKGFLFRYEYNPRPPSAPQDGDKENSDSNMDAKGFEAAAGNVEAAVLSADMDVDVSD